MPKIKGHLVWGLDEVDRLFSCHYGSEVFGLFRSWHNERALDPVGPWSRLTLVIAYATEAHLFITDVNQSPFNVGIRLELEEFALDQVRDLNERYGTPVSNEKLLRRFHELLGGHPYLVRHAFNELAAGHSDFARLEATADREDGIFGDHLRRILFTLARDQELLEAVRAFLFAKTPFKSGTFYRLRSAGFIRGDSPAEARMPEMYASYLKRHLG